MKLFNTLILYIVSLAAFAQTGTIKGNIKDNSGNPVPNANISLERTSYGNTSDEHGNYHIRKIPAGNYTVLFSAIGFQSITKSIEVKANETVEVNFLLGFF